MNPRTVGTAAAGCTVSASAISHRAACRASPAVNALRVPSVLLMTEPAQRRCAIRSVVRAVLSRSTASRPTVGAKARAFVAVIFVLFALYPFGRSVVNGGGAGAPRFG